jgi:hypothetical protein
MKTKKTDARRVYVQLREAIRVNGKLRQGRCRTLTVFEASLHEVWTVVQKAVEQPKEWRPRATTLRDNIIQDLKPLKQAFDKAKQPTLDALDAENGYLNQLNTEIANITSKCTTWQREEQRKADAEKERKRQADIAEKEQQRKAKADEE